MKKSKRPNFIGLYLAVLLITLALEFLLLVPSLETQQAQSTDELQATQLQAAANLVELAVRLMVIQLDEQEASLSFGDTSRALRRLPWALVVGAYNQVSGSIQQISRTDDPQGISASIAELQSAITWQTTDQIVGLEVDGDMYLLITDYLASDQTSFALADPAFLTEPLGDSLSDLENVWIATDSGETVIELITSSTESIDNPLYNRYTSQESFQNLLDGDIAQLDLTRTDEVQVHVTGIPIEGTNLIIIGERIPSAFDFIGDSASSRVLLISISISAVMVFLLAIGSSVTLREQHRYEEQIEEERDRSQRYLDVAAEIILALDQNHHILMINRTGAQILGYASPQELVGLDWMSFIPDEQVRAVDQIFQAAIRLEAGLDQETENLITTRSGENRLIAWKHSIVRRPDGTIIGTLSSGRDITEFRKAQRIREKSEQRLNLALQGANLGTWEFDPETGLYTLDSYSLELLGYVQDPLIGRSLISLVHPEDQARILDAMECHLTGLSSWYSEEFRVRNGKDQYRWVHAMGQQAPGEDEKVRVNGVLYDITNEKETLQTLAYHTQFERIRSEQFGKLLSSSFEDFESTAEETLLTVAKFIKADSAMILAQLNGKNKIGVQIVTTGDIIQHTDIGQVLTNNSWLREQLQSQSMITIERIRETEMDAGLKKYLGDHGIESIIALPLQSKTGESGIVAFCNINEPYVWGIDGDKPLRLVADTLSSALSRHAYEAELLKFLTLAETANYGVCILDLDWHTVYVNKYCAHIHGYTSEEAIGLSVEAYFPVTQHQALEECRKLLLTKGNFSRDDLVHMRKDGSTFPVMLNGAMVRDDNGKPLFTAMSVTDISERVEFVKQLEQSSEEVRRANDELRQFTYIVSHDLRAPLVNLKGFAQELRYSIHDLEPAVQEALAKLDEEERDELSTILNDDIPESLSFIERAVGNMDDMVNALLQLSRMGRRELLIEPVDMRLAVDDAVAVVSHQIAEHKGQVTVGDLPVVQADHTSMQQVLGNLIGNAVKYLSDDRSAQIDISAEEENGYWIFHIHDNGVGIAEEDFANVFAPFRRVGRQDVPGEGMGLPYVQALVRRHGGELWFESELNVGSTFSFSLPKDMR